MTPIHSLTLSLSLAGCWTGGAQPGPAAPAAPPPVTVAQADPPAAPDPARPDEARSEPAPAPVASPPAEPIAPVLAAVHPPPAHYVLGRIALGYGTFDYPGYMEGGFTYPPGTTSGITFGGGVSYGWYVADRVALGLMIDFDSLIAPSADKDGMSLSGIAGVMPNGTAGGMLAWHASDAVTLETDLAVGGGGTSKAVGGIGLEIHEQLVIAAKRTRDGLVLGPVFRVTWGPLMTDPVNGGSLMYYSVDAGLGILIGR